MTCNSAGHDKLSGYIIALPQNGFSKVVNTSRFDVVKTSVKNFTFLLALSGSDTYV